MTVLDLAKLDAGHFETIEEADRPLESFAKESFEANFQSIRRTQSPVKANGQ